MRPVRLAASVLALAGVLAASPADAARPARDGRLQGAYALTGVVRADHVRGERSGQIVRRVWTFSSSCPRGACRTVRLRRPRAGGGVDAVTLRRIARGVYRGRGRFFFPLACGRRMSPRGGEAPFTITVRVTRVATVQSTAFATGVAATYTNPRRLNHTRCPGDVGHDSARYGGHLTGGVPSPPQPSFTATRESPVSTTYDFRDTSAAGRGGARVVAWRWSFGDPGSGAANASGAAAPSHAFSAPGSYTVTLTVTDANGLTSTVSEPVQV